MPGKSRLSPIRTTEGIPSVRVATKAIGISRPTAGQSAPQACSPSPHVATGIGSLTSPFTRRSIPVVPKDSQIKHVVVVS
ncbi:Hypothetical predicted protein [Olea europaea subsp. europaea]|uniref:Uncharacterized protein n=1 Tax=Olea europaea subsp. europaea TaxID=158383 RepID=A0A8S0RN22_OLEEU|nr:Hypothetical predicted protein [Olea europaea subsp. europaea]